MIPDGSTRRPQIPPEITYQEQYDHRQPVTLG
jgi:hypothetical protein